MKIYEDFGDSFVVNLFANLFFHCVSILFQPTEEEIVHINQDGWEKMAADISQSSAEIHVRIFSLYSIIKLCDVLFLCMQINACMYLQPGS